LNRERADARVRAYRADVASAVTEQETLGYPTIFHADALCGSLHRRGGSLLELERRKTMCIQDAPYLYRNHSLFT